MKRAAAILAFTFLACLALLPFDTQAAWEKTSGGTRYTTEAEPGYYTGWHKIGKYTYYFNQEGYRVKGWKKIDGHTYYFSKKGRMKTGLKKVGKYYYYFGNDGIRRTGWQSIPAGEKTNRYYFSAKKGRMQTGIITVDGKMYCLSKAGILQYGRISLNGKVYYANPQTGVLAVNTWIDNTYYFQADGTMAVNKRINGRYVGADGRFTGDVRNVGFVVNGGVTRYYDAVSNLVYGFATINGKKYYFQSGTGAMMTGWFTVSGKTYYADKNGVIQTSMWVGNRYLTASGAMATGWASLKNKRYYFKSDGTKATGFVTISGKTYYFTAKGVQKRSCWLTVGGNKYYLDSAGVVQKGVTKVGKKYYYFSNRENGKLLYKWIAVSNGVRYYAQKSEGYLMRSTFFKKGKYKYYALSDCKIATGLKTINGKIYYFKATTGRMLTSAKYTVNGDTYYFSKKGYAVKKKWKKIDGKYYYFGANGKMLKNTVVGGYQVGSDGARGSKVEAANGWITVGTKRCYYSNGKPLTGWQTIGGERYYLDKDGGVTTGAKTIGGKKYCFYTTGVLAVNVTVFSGNKQYTTDANGIVTKEESINITGNNKGAQIAKYALQFVGNRYVWGGTSLTDGADCSGFVYTIFKNYGISLLRVADDQMKGPSSTYISQGYKQATRISSYEELLPGDLVFYGSGNYASHVALYIGDGKVVHASNSAPYPQGGIKISSYNYNTPIAYVRYWA